jgi:L-methionine (R)-S-oxide reductase
MGVRTVQLYLEAIVEQFGADTGTIHIVQDDVLVLRAQVGLRPELVQVVSRVPIGKGMAGLAVERNKPVSSCNIQSDRTGDVRPGAKQTGVGGAVVVPIRDSGGTAVGALGIGVQRPHEYSDAEVARLLEQAARLLAPAQAD